MELKKITNHGIIFAGYTVVNVLLQHGIIPDFVVTIDGRQLIHENQEQRNTTFDIPLIYSPFTDSRLLKKHNGIKINQVLSYDEYSKSLNVKLNKSYKPIYTAGTVAATIMDIAYYMGCNPIVFVGQDLAFTNDKTHVSGTYYENETDYENKFIHREDCIKVKDIFGKEIKTNYVFMQYKKGMEDYIDLKKETCQFIDATEGGAYIEGSSICPLAEVISNYQNCNQIDVAQIINELKKQVINNNDSKEKSDKKLNTNYILLDIQDSIMQLKLLYDWIKQVLDEIEILLQEKEENEKQKESKYLELVLDKIEEGNKRIDDLNKQTALFQLAILARSYRAEKEILTLKESNMSEQDSFIAQSISFFKRIIRLYKNMEKYIL